jgi:hypothetical protein
MSPSVAFPPGKREFASEIKFLVEAAKADQIRTWARERLAADPNATDAGDTYAVTSIYYDTPELAIFHRQSWLRHSKFRIRRYGSGVIFLERKLKIRGLVAKRRSLLSPEEFSQLDKLPNEARWFAHKTLARRLRPVCQIDYLRTARVSMTDTGPIRLTLDAALHAVPLDAPTFRNDSRLARLTDDVVVELKFRRDLPVLFRELAAEFSLNPRSFSKYRTAVQALGLAPVVPIAGTLSADALPEAKVICPSS